MIKCIVTNFSRTRQIIEDTGKKRLNPLSSRKWQETRITTSNGKITIIIYVTLIMESAEKNNVKVLSVKVKESDFARINRNCQKRNACNTQPLNEYQLTTSKKQLGLRSY